MLVAATAAALGLATALGAPSLDEFWARPLALVARGWRLDLSLHQWVNDGLMALFFLLVGLELKREMLVGELSSIRDAALPLVAAAGGMIVPALIYAAFNAGLPTASGWGVPMATDIAFAVGILVLLAWRIPRSLIIFLSAVAIADDLGAVLVIATFYTPSLDLPALGLAAAILVVMLLFNRSGIRHPLPYAVAGFSLWCALHASGIHATLAGVLLAFTIPARPAHRPAEFEQRIDELQAAFRADRRDDHTPDDPLSNSRMASIAEAMERSAVAVQSPLQRIEHSLTPWVAFIIVPVFALANAGIDLRSVAWGEALSSSVTTGVLTGLVVGKFVGVSFFSWLAVRLGVARLPPNVRWTQLLGAAWLCGIGFTMSLFISQLAFTDPAAIEQAKLGILLGSGLSATLGFCWLLWASQGGESAGHASSRVSISAANSR